MKHQVAVIRQPARYDDGLVQASVAAAVQALGLRWTDLIQPGQRALLKPNFIRQSHTDRPGEWEQIITHGTVIAAVARAVAEAMNGRGTLTIADAPQTDSDFDAICRRTRLPELRTELAREFPELTVELLDLRREVWRTERGVIVERRKLPEDPRGYELVDLGEKSFFHGKGGRFYGADYDSSFTQRHHAHGRHEYLLSRTAMDADLFVNLPKWKTHKKVGITVSLKNLVGINGDKNYLPHFCLGTPDEGGDEFPDNRVRNKVQSRLVSALKGGPWWTPAVKRVGSKIFGDTSKVVRSGNWHGNDTTWRMVLDLNRAFFARPRRYISIVDGIIAGEGDGPMEADAKPCGVLLAGTNPFAVDLAAAQLMGFDWRKLPMIREGITEDQVEVVPELGKVFQFKPHFGWKGHVEAD
ncbi:MAG: DUF362 domain-containing protein [Verrucomicrobia bacterium]|nr:DUF362 domain-containing protein [Verrucomicrobiota bacterium]